MNIFEDSSFIDFNQSNLLAYEEEIQSVTKTFIAKAIRNIEFIASTQINEIKSKTDFIKDLETKLSAKIYSFFAEESIQISELTDEIIKEAKLAGLKINKII